MDADGLWKAWTASMYSKNPPAHPSHEPLQNRRTDAGFGTAPTGRGASVSHDHGKENLP